MPGGSLVSKPTWPNTSGVPPRRLFLFLTLQYDQNHGMKISDGKAYFEHSASDCPSGECV
jgi:hypothetical protein